MGIDGLSLGTSFRLASENQENGMYSEMKIGDENYLDLYDLKLLAGRNFKTTKKTFDQFVVNEALIKTYNWTPQEAIGKQLTINEGEGTIVGVVFQIIIITHYSMKSHLVSLLIGIVYK